MSNNAVELAEALKRRIQTQDEEIATEFISELSAAIESPIKVVPEPVFRELFLPYITGQKRPTDESPTLNHWMGLVGGAGEAASVVNEQGEELFRVPPLFDTSRIDPTARGGGQLGQAFKDYADDSRVHQIRADNELRRTLAARLIAIVKPENSKASDWKPVYDYYKIHIENGKVVSAPTGAAPVATSANTDEGFSCE